ncbi:MAG: sigma-70 family RNA polymerase sigma factor [Bacteroidetes bacterium]|nr:sigma-70 family RNA polymerase sigma factor [Bacteroidota bacterium]
MSDHDLITACKSGDPQARRQIYDQTIDRVYNLTLRMLRTQEDAMDVSQDVYVKVFSRIGQFRGESSLSTWIHRIAVNEVLAFLRRKNTEQRHLDAVGLEQNEPPTQAFSDVERIDINDALAQLNHDDRLILLLRYDQGNDYRAIAELLECAEGTVASRLNRARERLKALFANGDASQEEIRTPAHPIDGRRHETPPSGQGTESSAVTGGQPHKKGDRTVS